jgi:hypothetical protein
MINGNNKIGFVFKKGLNSYCFFTFFDFIPTLSTSTKLADI